jgi:uncharacterized membrane protein YcfT
MRQTWMDSLRGTAIMLVVVLHAGLGLGYYATGIPRPIEVFNQFFEPYRMPTLMFLTGILLSRSLAKGTGPYIRGKLRNVGWPYVVWSVIILGLQGDLDLASLARGIYNPVGTHLWYLWFLLIFYGLALLLRWVPTIVPLAVCLVASGFLPEAYRLEKFAFLFAFFLLGHLFAQHREAVARWSSHRGVLAAAAVAALIASGFNIAGVKVLYEPVFAVGVIGAILLALHFMPLLPAGRVNTLLQFVGRNSIIVYVSHLSAIKIVGTLMGRYGFDNPWVMFPILVAVGLGTGFVLIWASTRFRAARLLFAWPPPRARVGRAAA